MLMQKLQADQLSGMKSGEKQKVETLRYILAQIKNKEIEKRTELSDDEILGILKKIAKELKESIEAFQKGNREDLASQSQNQYDILLTYLPAELTDEELQKEINRIIEENKELYQKNAKAIIGICMKELRNKADSARIMKFIPS